MDGIQAETNMNCMYVYPIEWQNVRLDIKIGNIFN